MNHASLFSGIGGAEVAASMMGWQNLFHCEIQEFPRKVLDYWYPDSESYEDITKTDFCKWRGKVDVLTGGFPCQPFSVAGLRKGSGDDRYLWPEMLRAIRQIQPTWVVGENVAGLTTMVESCQTTKMGRTDDLFEENYLYREESWYTLDKICTDLEGMGYAVQPIIVPACAVGAPHRRDRLWIVAYANSDRQRQRKSEQESVAKCSRTSDLGTCRSKRLTSDTLCVRSHEIYEDLQSRQSDGAEFDGTRVQRYAGSQPHWADSPQDRWQDFPTQSPVCGGDDGIPFDVDHLTISFARWRKESIKAYGNAWVPQVAYEIFRAIEELS